MTEHRRAATGRPRPDRKGPRGLEAAGALEDRNRGGDRTENAAEAGAKERGRTGGRQGEVEEGSSCCRKRPSTAGWSPRWKHRGTDRREVGTKEDQAIPQGGVGHRRCRHHRHGRSGMQVDGPGSHTSVRGRGDRAAMARRQQAVVTRTGCWRGESSEGSSSRGRCLGRRGGSEATRDHKPALARQTR